MKLKGRFITQKVTEYGDDSTDDSFGPPPPPPPPPPVDGNKKEIFHFDNMPDPPAQISIVKNRASQVDEGLTNESTEIPPTRVLRRMLVKEQIKSENSKLNRHPWKKITYIIGCLLVLLAIALSIGFGMDIFTKTSENAASAGDGHSGGAGRSSDITMFLGYANNGGYDVFNHPENAETGALNWLITDDPLQLTPNNDYNRFRLSQRYALLTMWFGSKFDWNDETNWLQNADECTWHGVICEEQEVDGIGLQNVVTKIEMADNYLHGEISEDLAMLTSITTLDLSDNDLQGTIPTSLWTLSNLEELDLSENFFTGTISRDISNLVNLGTLFC